MKKFRSLAMQIPITKRGCPAYMLEKRLIILDVDKASITIALIDSDKLEGVIRNPFAFYFSIQRGFSGSIQTLPFADPFIRRGALVISSGFLERISNMI
jgi:hypothetical protein